MIQRVARIVAWGVVAGTIALAACGGQSSVPSLGSQPSNQNQTEPQDVTTPSPSPTASATVKPHPSPTGTVIAYGDTIGVPTFPDGSTSSGGQGKSVDGYICHPPPMDQPYHIHIHLDIFDQNGNQLQLPWGIGAVQPWQMDALDNAVKSATCFYDLHTHDHDGVIHYESAQPEGALNLGYFFDVWGMPLSTTNVAGYTGTVWVMYGTKAPKQMTWSDTVDPRTIPLTEHEFIYLAINNPPSPKVLPVYHWSY